MSFRCLVGCWLQGSDGAEVSVSCEGVVQRGVYMCFK
ncbi:hypothetical protein E2C01_077804 [Portunus trituberculatus]|uniref:Uncharacterized protein n=1 Tax=Portunus trituberculatus TaxID=210409 RepID=A0A5B7IGY5_PORTR|nr:hypothetical protein [Portunus trituberculatus]